MEIEPAQSPLVTVVIPAYNRESCVGNAIESVLAQETDFQYEVIVVDDGSTDGTAEIGRSYGYPVKVINKKNGGPASARNAGVLAAQSPLIAFLDSDDLMLPGRLARQASYMLTHPDVVLTFGNMILDSDANGNYLKRCNLPYEDGQWLIVDDPYRRLMTEINFVTTVTTMVRKEDFLKAGMLDESLWVAEDFELWTRMCSMGKFAYCCCPFARVRRNLQDNLMSSPHFFTDVARARHMTLLRDRILNGREKQQSLALLRKFLLHMLRDDLLERGRRTMLRDLREYGFWFGRWFFLKWWAISLMPRSLAKQISRVRQRNQRKRGAETQPPERQTAK